MRYRKLDANGDYVFGRSASNFLIDGDAVVQAIKTSLALIKGSWWRDTTAGFDLYSILGHGGAPENQAAADGIIQGVILDVEGVSSILAYSSQVNNREYSYTATVQTIYSTSVISGVL